MSESRERTPRTDTALRGRVAVDAAEYDTLAMAVVGAVAAAEGVSELALSPLYDAGVDPDALNALFEGSETHVEGFFSFSYAGYLVTVTSDGSVTAETRRTV